MNSMQRRIPSELFYPFWRGLSLFLAVLLLFIAAGLPARAQMTPDVDSGINDSGFAEDWTADPQATESLQQWLHSHAQSGGTYTMTGNVDWPGEYIVIMKQTVIHMNGYGIHVPKEHGAMFYGPITFIGGQSSVPMFTLEPGAGLGFDGNVRIEVTDGYAVNVKGSCVNEGNGDCYLSFNFASITARGKKSTAIKVEGNADLSFMRMHLFDGACGIESDGNVNLAVSEINAYDGESFRAGGVITLDASNVTPWAADPLPRTAEPFLPASIIFLSQKERDGLPADITISLCRDGAQTLTLIRPLRYDEKEIPSAKGIYQLTAYPEQLPFADPAVIFPPVVYNVIVPEPDRFYLQELLILKRNMCHFLLYPEACEVKAVRVSTDAGNTWMNLPHNNGFFSLEQFQPGVYWFQLQLNTPDGINPMTSIMELEIAEDGLTIKNSIGGDRDDSHRDDLTNGSSSQPIDMNLHEQSEKNSVEYAPDSVKRSAPIRAFQATDSMLRRKMENQQSKTSSETGSVDDLTEPIIDDTGQALAASASTPAYKPAEPAEPASKALASQPSLEPCPAPDDAPSVPVADEAGAFGVLLLFFAAAAAGGGLYILLARRGEQQ